MNGFIGKLYHYWTFALVGQICENNYVDDLPAKKGIFKESIKSLFDGICSKLTINRAEQC